MRSYLSRKYLKKFQIKKSNFMLLSLCLLVERIIQT